MRGRRFPLALAVTALCAVALGEGAPNTPAAIEVIATGVSRPLQIVVDGDSLVILSPGSTGGVAGEVYRVDLRSELPIDLSRQPRIRIPYVGTHPTMLGSLAIDPRTRQLFLGEENGRTIYRLTADEQLSVYAVGLRLLGGGGTIVFDAAHRLVVVDYVDPMLSRRDERTAPGLEAFKDEEDYRGPLVFRLVGDPAIALPRRLELLAPLFPRAWGGRAGGRHLPRLIAVAPVGDDDLVFLTAAGEMYRLGADGTFAPFTRLPRGQYNRITMTSGPEGAVFVSGGFHVAQIFRVASDGTVSVLATGLADPEGIALDARGEVYVAESALHRIVRIRPGRG
jgi:hypothetical protein